MTSAVRGPVAAAVLVALLSACVPGQPDRATWREDGSTTLTDVAGQLATAALTIEHDDDLIGGYDIVVLTDAEELAGTSADSFTSQQPPEGELEEYERVSTALDDALSALADARIAVVNDNTAAYPGLVRQLNRLDARLQRLATTLEKGPR